MYSERRRSSSALRFARIIPAIALAAACSRQDKPSAADSSLARDLELAQQQAPALYPADTALRQSAPTRASQTPRRAPVVRQTRATPNRPTPDVVAERPTPATNEPTPLPAPAPAASPTPNAGVGYGLAGTGLGMTTSTRICTSNRPGDKLVAQVSESSGPGASKIPPGSTVVLEIAQIQYDEAHPENSQIIFRVRGIAVGDQDYPGTGATATSGPGLEKVATNSRSSDVKKVAAGAIAGAILGQVLGKNTKGTVIGAAAGAAAGAAVAGATRKYEACLPSGAPLHVTLGAA
jgi:hypothetical protein